MNGCVACMHACLRMTWEPKSKQMKVKQSKAKRNKTRLDGTRQNRARRWRNKKKDPTHRLDHGRAPVEGRSTHKRSKQTDWRLTIADAREIPQFSYQIDRSPALAESSTSFLIPIDQCPLSVRASVKRRLATRIQVEAAHVTTDPCFDTQPNASTFPCRHVTRCQLGWGEIARPKLSG